MKNIRKEFTGTVALDDMDLDIYRGEVHAIMGENGAGKSTLMKILTGVYKMTAGQIFIDGNEVQIKNVEDSIGYGISMIYQELANLPKLSVSENIYVGQLPTVGNSSIIDFKQLYKQTQDILDEFNIEIDARQQLSKLSIAGKQFAEIVKAITLSNSSIVIMDEPTSSLSSAETEKLFSIIEKLKQKNIGVIYISHRVDEVFKIADRISVFRNGKNRGTLERGQYDEGKIISLMLGHDLEIGGKRSVRRDEVALEVRNLNIENHIFDFNMKLYKGEILGVAGLMGSGKDELVKSLFGLWPAKSKEIYYEGKKVRINSPKDALKLKIAYLPEERKTQSLFHDLDVKNNIAAIWLFLIAKKYFFDEKKEFELSKEYIDMLSIKTSSPLQKIVNLSGGNQQKAVIARLLAIKPKIMILNDPTRGIDVGSKEEIYRIIKELAQQGTSIIVVTSELEEIERLADRVVILSRGEICGEFADEEVKMSNVLPCAVGVRI